MHLLQGYPRCSNTHLVSERLKNKNPMLKGLEIGLRRGQLSNNFFMEEYADIGRDIGNNTILKSLTIKSNIIRVDDGGGDTESIILKAKCEFESICHGLGENHSIYEFLVDFDDDFLGESIFLLAPFLINNPSLEKVTINIRGLTRIGFHSIVTSIACRSRPIRELCFVSTQIGDEEVEHMVTIFEENPELTPQNVSLSGNNIGLGGCNSIARLLRNQNCRIDHLALNFNRNIRDDGIVALADACANNSTLRVLSICETSITTIGWNAFRTLLCNPDINKIASSNHTIRSFGNFPRGSRVMPPILCRLLEINIMANVKKVARQKILLQHFSRDSGMGMEFIQDIMPCLKICVMEFVTKAIAERIYPSDNGREQLDFIYNVFRSNPLICEQHK